MMRSENLRRWIPTLIGTLLFFYAASSHAQLLSGVVLDAASGKRLEGAVLAAGEGHTRSLADGHFVLPTDSSELIVKLPGYRAKRVSAPSCWKILLEPFAPKALYLSFWAASVPERRQQILELIDKTGLNALVIDIKSARGYIAYRSRIPLAREIGAQQVRPLKDLPEFLAELKSRGIYTIGRIVVFKDDLLARQRPQYAVHTRRAHIWEDREQLAWTDPFNKQVHAYNLAVAEEAAELGFDEIQFDYIRFPAQSDLVFSRPATDDSRVESINSFLDQARQRLAGTPAYLSANIFGYICWKHKDGKIGQRLVELGERVDYLTPMLYPSGFPHGVPGYANPVEFPYQVIADSLLSAQKLSRLPAIKFRPWLQAFKDYAFDRRRFGSVEIHAQINASDAVGSHGWMLWNASSRFSLASLEYRMPLYAKKLVDIEPVDASSATLSRYSAEDKKEPAL